LLKNVAANNQDTRGKEELMGKNNLIFNKMRPFKIISLLVICIGILFGSTSCAVNLKHDNGKHKGWYKNSNNPHHRQSTNPGKAEGKHKK